MDKEEEGSLQVISMPVITVDLQDLKSLIDRPVSDEQLETVLPLIKCEIDSRDGDEFRIEVTPDRPDLLSTEGIARQVSYWLGFRRGLHKFNTTKPRLTMTADAVLSRPEIVAGCVRGVEMSNEMVRSIMQLQEAIDFTIGRDRAKTAIGVHDVSAVKPPFYYKEVGPKDISFVPLGFSREMTIEDILNKHPKGVKYRQIFGRGKRYPIILDRKDRVLSFPPIINGELTKVTPDTTDMFLDITGFDQTPLNHALNILLGALEMRGGVIESVKINNRTYPHMKARPVKVERDSIKSMLGVSLRDNEIEDCLERMGYGVDMSSGSVQVPAYRADILHPVDVIEDVAIAYGLNDFIPEMPKVPVVGHSDPEEDFALKLKELMVGLGFQEMVNLSLSNKERQFRFTGARDQGSIELQNPVSSEYSLFRHWLTPTLLENLSSNIHRRYPQRIFELADCVHLHPSSETRTRNVKKLAAAVSHADAGFSEIMSVFKAFHDMLPVELSIREHKHPTFIAGRCASILIGKKAIGVLGEIHPRVLTAFGLKMPVAALEIDSESLWSRIRTMP